MSSGGANVGGARSGGVVAASNAGVVVGRVPILLELR
jgi:hypothetical protein